MHLPAGTRLGPYEIAAPLGAGGMGEVYRARDTRLGRDVAVKVLPESVASDPDRRARFESEAKAVAALSHPNLLAIHDIGSQGSVVFAVMELLDGQTLRERLEDGALPVQRAVAFAIQMAHGLGAAHDKGIIHRDLKPENVMVTNDGRIKVLDFGLAKRAMPQGGDALSRAATIAVATEPGIVLGTPGYMAPEQVRGLPADARSDIFSLGAVLYEMVSGKRAFHGDSPADTMTAILREEPPELTQMARDVPPGIERLIRRCLEKQPEARFRSAQDLAFALEAASGSGRSESVAMGTAALSAHAPEPTFRRLTFRNGCISGAHFSPDGNSVVYGASWEGRPFELFTSRPESPESRSLGLPAADLLAISASGEMALSVGFRHYAK